MKTPRKPNEQLLSNRWPLRYQNLTKRGTHISPERLAQCLYGTSARGVSSLLHLRYSTRDKLKISKTVMNDDDDV